MYNTDYIYILKYFVLYNILFYIIFSIYLHYKKKNIKKIFNFEVFFNLTIFL